MKKSFMYTIKTVMAIILFAGLFTGCSAKESVRSSAHKAQEFISIKNIAVQTFACPDPAAANDVRNVIIAYLLDNYSVVIGEKADVVISGTITLHSEEVSPASSARAAGRVKAISSDIMKNGRILDSVSITESPAYGSLEAMGNEIAKQIAGKLSKMSSDNP